MTISDYITKPVREARVINLKLHGFTCDIACSLEIAWVRVGSPFKLYDSNHLGLVKVSHDN